MPLSVCPGLAPSFHPSILSALGAGADSETTVKVKSLFLAPVMGSVACSMDACPHHELFFKLAWDRARALS